MNWRSSLTDPFRLVDQIKGQISVVEEYIASSVLKITIRIQICFGNKIGQVFYVAVGGGGTPQRSAVPSPHDVDISGI